jgi:hypothetical protein
MFHEVTTVHGGATRFEVKWPGASELKLPRGRANSTESKELSPVGYDSNRDKLDGLSRLES